MALPRWRDQHHPHLHLRELDPALVDDWVSSLREQVAAALQPQAAKGHAWMGGWAPLDTEIDL